MHVTLENRGITFLQDLMFEIFLKNISYCTYYKFSVNFNCVFIRNLDFFVSKTHRGGKCWAQQMCTVLTWGDLFGGVRTRPYWFRDETCLYVETFYRSKKLYKKPFLCFCARVGANSVIAHVGGSPPHGYKTC